jgi:hypothetical protein
MPYSDSCLCLFCYSDSCVIRGVPNSMRVYSRCLCLFSALHSCFACTCSTIDFNSCLFCGSASMSWYLDVYVLCLFVYWVRQVQKIRNFGAWMPRNRLLVRLSVNENVNSALHELCMQQSGALSAQWWRETDRVWGMMWNLMCNLREYPMKRSHARCSSIPQVCETNVLICVEVFVVSLCDEL